MKMWKLFLPGLKIKRWLFVFSIGLICSVIGLTVIFNLRVLGGIEQRILILFNELFANRQVIIFIGAFVFLFGILLSVIAFYETVKSVLQAFNPAEFERIMQVVYEKKQLDKGPKVVAIGGGTGLSTILRGFKEFTNNITAVVVVSDDGGSSGRLRKEFGVLPPGDIRNCLVALADKEPLMEKLFQHRFSGPEGLKDHSFGNLFITTLSEVSGDFLQAVKESSKILAVRGKVLPVTLTNVMLNAETLKGEIISGETAIGANRSGGIRRVFLEPEDCHSIPEVMEAIADADIVIMGPGSLYTSIMPNLLIGDIIRSLKRTQAARVFICNVMTQPGETDGYSAYDHVDAVIKHAGKVIDYVFVNEGKIKEEVLERYEKEGRFPVANDCEKIEALGIKCIIGDFSSSSDLARHDGLKIAKEILNEVLKDRGEFGKKQMLEYYLNQIGKKMQK